MGNMIEKIFKISDDLIKKDIKIHLFYTIFENFNNNPVSYDFSDSIINPETKEITNKYTIDNIKDDPIIAAYREFYWKYMSIDPTKIRPSGEALIRRILQGKELPKINYFVDAYNWASAVSLIPVGAYDLDKFKGIIELRGAKAGEKFYAIGDKEVVLKGNELITISNNGTILSQFPYRDAEITKVTENTHRILVLSLGIEHVSKEALMNGINLTIMFLKKCKIPIETDFRVSEPIYVTNF
jgi:DNA/RNA-binding domain of Phe-tRNA-synthetase-like protein